MKEREDGSDTADRRSPGYGSYKIEMEKASDMVYDNFPIKVYAFDTPSEVFVRLAGGAKRLSVCIGEQGTTAELELYGADSEGKTLADYANDEIISRWWQSGRSRILPMNMFRRSWDTRARSAYKH